MNSAGRLREVRVLFAIVVGSNFGRSESTVEGNIG